MLPLSILDLSFVTTATPGSQAIRNTIDLARLADELGYCRFWVAEHHNLPSVASAAPEVMIAAIAAATQRIRVGSGGVMLPNHAALMVAERFKVLEALHPGRIDLGLGRAPGTDARTMFALRRQQERREGDDFLEPLGELLAWKRGGFPEGHPLAGIRVMPEDVELPPFWLLGSSDYSARLAARLGLGFAFAHHFASHDAEEAMFLYRGGFRPSAWLAEPHAILATAAICAENDVEAERLAATADLAYVRRLRGIYQPLPAPDEASAHIYSPPEEHARRENRRRLFVGGPARLHHELSAFAARLKADELMLTAAIADHAARRRSFALLAQAFGLGNVGS